MRIRSIHQRNGGFTLVELLISMVAFGLIALIIPKISLEFTKSLNTANANIKAQETLRLVSRQIDKFLSQAKRSTVIITQDTGEPPFSRIQYKNISGQQVAIYQSKESLIQVTDGKIFTVVHESLDRITFAYPDIHDDSRIQISVAAKREKKSGKLSLATSFVKLEYQ